MELQNYIMELYPPPNGEVSFEQMEALSRRVIAKDKTYPAGNVTGLATIMREVYANRIFAFRFLKIFRKKKGILGGAISHLGILMTYNDHSNAYPWSRVKSLNITRTSYNNPNNTYQNSGYSYDIYFGLMGINGEDQGFNINAEMIRCKEFPKDMNKYYEKYAAEMCAFYYNRIRAERLNWVLSYNNKSLLSHHQLKNEYLEEVSQKLNTPEGINLKYLRQRVNISLNGIIHRKGKKKVILDVKWNQIDDMIIGLGSRNPLIMLKKKKDFTPEREYFQPFGWKFITNFKIKGAISQIYLLPLAWLESK